MVKKIMIKYFNLVKKIPFSSLSGIIIGIIFGLLLISNTSKLFSVESLGILIVFIIISGQTLIFLETIERVKNLFYTTFLVALYTYFCFQINFFALMVFPLVLSVYYLYLGILKIPSMIQELEKKLI